MGTSFKLHSHKINYGTGSGQQVVSAINDNNDPQSLWVLKEPFEESICTTGRRIACGQKVRLEHIVSGKNLHSDPEFKAPFSLRQEVSLFGSNGRGDSNDDWVLECPNDPQDYVKGETVLMLKHAETGKYLVTDNEHTFTQDNCRNCPIIGQREVSVSINKGKPAQWQIVGVPLIPHP